MKASRPAEQSDSPTKRVAIVHDWLYGGGAELVVEQLHVMYPNAPIYTSYCSDEWRKRLDGKVVTGWLQHLGGGRLRKFVPLLRIWWFTRLDLSDYDLVISSAGYEAKGVRAGSSYKAGQLHLNYCHAPTHYCWSRYDSYLQNPGFGGLNWLARIGLRVLVGPLRRWDYRAAQRADYMLANSTHIQAEIKKYYRRDSTVIFPPVYFERFQRDFGTRTAANEPGFVISGRQVPYKCFDLAIIACSRLGVPLTAIGDGPDHERLRSLAGPTVRFLGRASDEVLEREFANARALIFPGTDDFGITPVEAMASGRPVIAYRAGGALDYVIPGKTGEFFDEPNVDSLTTVLQNFDNAAYQPAEIRKMAARFTKESFRERVTDFLNVL